MKALFDTNILIDYLNGIVAARREIETQQERHISLITWMEVLVGADDVREEQEIQAFLQRFRKLGISSAVADRAVRVKRRTKLKLPDAIIYATAEEHGLLLITRNTRDFPAADPLVHVPY